jgi:HD-GYP domain-containing protein (c-di-GMP phosphodiesterase class II)
MRLAGEEIPLAARIIHVLRAYDSMRTNRIYQPTRSGAEALAELERLAGSQFCPRSVAALDQALDGGTFGGEPLVHAGEREIAS